MREALRPSATVAFCDAHLVEVLQVLLLPSVLIRPVEHPKCKRWGAHSVLYIYIATSCLR